MAPAAVRLYTLCVPSATREEKERERESERERFDFENLYFQYLYKTIVNVSKTISGSVHYITEH